MQILGMTRAAAVAAIPLVLFGAAAHAGGGPENVFLLINRKSPESLEVANHYINLRKVPPQNVLYVEVNPKSQALKGQQFIDSLLKPALAAIGERKLNDQVDYLVYSAGFPWWVNMTDYLEGEFPKQLAPRVSISGATFLYRHVLQKRRAVTALNSNFYFAMSKHGITMSRGFRSQHAFGPTGERVKPEKGMSYLLSASLGVTWGRGNTTPEIQRYLKRAADADGTKPKGTIYFAKNRDIRSRARHDEFEKAATAIRIAGVAAKVVETKFPQNRPDIMGLIAGGAQLKVATSGSRMLPGAFCENLTSFGGWFGIPKKPPGQTCISEFLRLGAAGACGTVTEPYLIPQKFPVPTMHVHYVRGCSLAESFYQSVQGPYQQILVGDPLCRPWAEIPTVKVEGLAERTVLEGVVEITPSAPKSTTPIGRFEFYVDGRRREACKPGETISLDTTKLADGYHEFRVVAIDSTPIETQGRWIGQAVVKNGRDALQVSLVDRRGNRGGDKLLAEVASTTAETVVIEHNGREVATVDGGNGSVSIGTKDLGRGPITLHAFTRSGSRLRARPVLATID